MLNFNFQAMAVIINGEVVADNDPRAVRYRSRGLQQNPTPAPAAPMNRTASIGSEVQSDVSSSTSNSNSNIFSQHIQYNIIYYIYISYIIYIYFPKTKKDLVV